MTSATYSLQVLSIIAASIKLIDTHKLDTTPLNEGSARRKDLYLTTDNIHKRQISMALAGFEPSIPASEQPQLDHPTTGFGL